MLYWHEKRRDDIRVLAFMRFEEKVKTISLKKNRKETFVAKCVTVISQKKILKSKQQCSALSSFRRPDVLHTQTLCVLYLNHLLQYVCVFLFLLASKPACSVETKCVLNTIHNHRNSFSMHGEQFESSWPAWHGFFLLTSRAVGISKGDNWFYKYNS